MEQLPVNDRLRRSNFQLTQRQDEHSAGYYRGYNRKQFLLIADNPNDAEYKSDGNRYNHEQPSKGCKYIASARLEYEKGKKYAYSCAEENRRFCAVVHFTALSR